MNFVDDKEWLTYDDVLMVPQYSDIKSRSEISLSGGKLNLDVPFISANMDTITEEDMAIAMHNAGGIGIIHRFLSAERLIKIIKRVRSAGIEPVVSIGINGDSDELLRAAIKYSVNRFCIDVAHGHHSGVILRIKQLRHIFKSVPNSGKNCLINNNPIIIAGNVGTADGYITLSNAGATIVKVGIGPGSHCTTRIVTGHGVPQLSAIIECANAKKLCNAQAEIIADGGIRNSGDIAKALAAGADYVMLGSVLAGCKETPGDIVCVDGTKVKSYRGMASFEAQVSRGKNRTPEGVASYRRFIGPVSNKIEELAGGVRSALSYTAARNLTEFREKAQFVRVTHSSFIEGTPHGVK